MHDPAAHIEALKHTSHRPDCFCSADKCSVDEKSISLYAKLLLKKAAAQRLVIDLPNEIKRCDALFEIDRFRRETGCEIKPLTVREILDEEIAIKA